MHDLSLIKETSDKLKQRDILQSTCPVFLKNIYHESQKSNQQNHSHTKFNKMKSCSRLKEEKETW